jgi:putative transposase
MSESLKSKLVVDAMEMALGKCSTNAKFIFHSDRGSQYASEVFRDLLKTNSLVPSMSRRGNCYDNCFVESWFKSLKSEWIYRHDYETEDQLRSLVFEYIEAWYNTKRRHSSLDYLSPKQYKQKYQLFQLNMSRGHLINTGLAIHAQS